MEGSDGFLPVPWEPVASGRVRLEGHRGDMSRNEFLLMLMMLAPVFRASNESDAAHDLVP